MILQCRIVGLKISMSNLSMTLEVWTNNTEMISFSVCVCNILGLGNEEINFQYKIVVTTSTFSHCLESLHLAHWLHRLVQVAYTLNEANQFHAGSLSRTLPKKIGCTHVQWP